MTTAYNPNTNSHLTGSDFGRQSINGARITSDIPNKSTKTSNLSSSTSKKVRAWVVLGALALASTLISYNIVFNPPSMSYDNFSPQLSAQEDKDLRYNFFLVQSVGMSEQGVVTDENAYHRLNDGAKKQITKLQQPGIINGLTLEDLVNIKDINFTSVEMLRYPSQTFIKETLTITTPDGKNITFESLERTK